jgi:type I restriction-modification system DNA methylase subunit
VLELHKEEEFKRFYYILCKQNLISTTATSTIDDLANISSKEDENITLKFYKDYKNNRLNLFNHLIQQNPDIEKIILLEKAQKILDRLIFILFCEDTGNLLPRNLVKNTYSLGIGSRERSDQRVWREFKNLFMDIDMGRSDIDPHINEYNGGLFATDEILDNLTIKDAIWKELVDLNKYDFESELNVNILGHIFEQSISDLEALRTAIQPNGKQEELKNGKRKKDGIFYTPEFITKYIVDRAIGTFLEENPDKLETIKILDPACGSGAFLNQAHNYLMREYRSRSEERLLEKSGIQQLDFSYINLAEQNRSILLNNLFGVDLNQESIEITKLSLWLKTASSSEPLQNLDKNIKCGNSIVDNPFYAGDKAFQWKEEFKEIIDTGGFDVIIGNPPYVRQEFIKEIKPYLEKNYELYTGVSDLYVYFFEKALNLLKEDGYFAFIVSNKFLRANYGKKLREYLQKNFTILELIDFGDLQIFEGATTYPCIILIQKKKPSLPQQIKYLKPSFVTTQDLGSLLTSNAQEIELGEETDWILEDSKTKAILNKLYENSDTLEAFIGGKIYRGILTGYNEAFIIDELKRQELIKKDPKSEGIIKPYLTGAEVKKYHINWNQKYIILSKDGTEIEKEYPAIYEHLLQYKEDLEKRWDKGKYWYNLRACSFYEVFENPKIIYPNITKEPNFTLDTNKYYSNQKTFLLPISDLFIVAILNSSTSKFWFNTKLPKLRGGFFEPSEVFLKTFPIPKANQETKDLIIELTKKRIELTKQRADETESSLAALKAETRLEKLSERLTEFYNLGQNELLEELTKQKVKLNINQKEELLNWFRRKQEIFKKSSSEISECDREINTHTYHLYNLDQNEISVIEETLSSS